MEGYYEVLDLESEETFQVAIARFPYSSQANYLAQFELVSRSHKDGNRQLHWKTPKHIINMTMSQWTLCCCASSYESYMPLIVLACAAATSMSSFARAAEENAAPSPWTKSRPRSLLGELSEFR